MRAFENDSLRVKVFEIKETSTDLTLKLFTTASITMRCTTFGAGKGVENMSFAGISFVIYEQLFIVEFSGISMIGSESTLSF